MMRDGCPVQKKFSDTFCVVHVQNPQAVTLKAVLGDPRRVLRCLTLFSHRIMHGAFTQRQQKKKI